MLKFASSSINSIISAFSDLKSSSKKYSRAEKKVFNSLREWSIDNNNTAIQDVSNKIQIVFSKMDTDLTQEKIDALKEVTQMFKKFKEFDCQVEKHHQNVKTAKKLEEKYFSDMRKCPSSKNIRDFEIRYNHAKENRIQAELKLHEFSQDIDVTKSILFKTHMKRLTEVLLKQNQAEKVFLNAMNGLFEELPDVSNEETDDITTITYTKHKQTALICSQAKKKLNRISNSTIAIKQENVNELAEIQIQQYHRIQDVLPVQASDILPPTASKNSEKSNPKTTRKANRVRISCPPKIIPFTEEIPEQEENKLFPSLNTIMCNYANMPPPPAYSDTESFVTTRSNLTDVLSPKFVHPSAPIYNQVTRSVDKVDSEGNSSTSSSNSSLSDKN